MKGEEPVKAEGKVLVIDGGFAHAYRKTTGTAGYTLISNSYGILLATHSPMKDEERRIADDIDITSSLSFVTEYDHRRLVKDTDGGKKRRRPSQSSPHWQSFTNPAKSRHKNKAPGGLIFLRVNSVNLYTPARGRLFRGSSCRLIARWRFWRPSSALRSRCAGRELRYCPRCPVPGPFPS